MFRVLPKHCASSMAKEPEKLHYKTIWMPFVYRTCNISRHILKMCNLPSFLYSFHSKEVITVKCWGARGKQRLAGACRNLLWTLMKNISTLFITKSTGHRWSKAHKLRYDGTPQGTIRERERLCTRVHACVCVCVLFLFHSGCEKNSDRMTKIVLCTQKSNGTRQLFSEWREKCSLKYQHHLFFSPVSLSSLEVPPLYIRTVLQIMTDFSANLFQKGKSVLYHKVSPTCQNEDEGEALMLFCFLFFFFLPSATLIHYLTLWIVFVIFSWHSWAIKVTILYENDYLHVIFMLRGAERSNWAGPKEKWLKLPLDGNPKLWSWKPLLSCHFSVEIFKFH